MNMCVNCKYEVIGKYSHVYKGKPVGCNSPSERLKCGKFKGEGYCFEPKEKK